MSKVYYSFMIFFSVILPSMAQIEIKGTVTDESGLPIPDVNISEKDLSNGAITDFDGNYLITVQEGATLVFTYVGYSTQQIKVDASQTLNILLESDSELEQIILVGSRSPKRTVVDTPVAIDVIDMKDVISKTGNVEINELLQYAAPSFNASRQSGSDGADHVVPATLRGLGPDQTLVLINGKRRHSSSLINLFGTRGRGNSGTDLNSIPTGAIKRIEILRDGAAAQYGSDAIAGVINIVLKDSEGFSGSVMYGAYNANTKGDFLPLGDSANTEGTRLDTSKDGNATTDAQDFDGGTVKVVANYGTKIGENGFANFTGEFLTRNKTIRPSYYFRSGYGGASVESYNFMGNIGFELSENTEFYAFGGRNYRDSEAFAFTRVIGENDDRIIASIYPNGFNPRNQAIVLDNSVSAGIRTETESGWKIDFNNTWGKNNFHYFIKATNNASLEEATPTDFDAGGHSLSQNTTAIDASKYFDNVAAGLNLAFGTEYRTENYIIFAGEEASYAIYDTNGRVVTDPSTQVISTDPVSGGTRPGASQGFPGYSPANEVDRSRSNLSVYADAELDITDNFLIAVAGRFEDYSDFGSTINGKLATRIKLSDAINLRGSVSTGFRAPSLVQVYFNTQFSDIDGSGGFVETLLASNINPLTSRSYGISDLKEETSLNASFGFTANFGNFTTTVDGYFIGVDDRIILTGQFDGPAGSAIDAVQFFTNGVDTETIGLDLVLGWKKDFSFGNIGASLVGNINQMDIINVNNGTLDEETFFGEREKKFLLASAPENKFIFNLNYSANKFNIGATTTRFSEIELIDFSGTELDYYDAKFSTDITMGYDITKNLNLTIGSNNVFNEYPDEQTDFNTESGGYWDAVQMGSNGAFYYTRLSFNF